MPNSSEYGEVPYYVKVLQEVQISILSSGYNVYFERMKHPFVSPLEWKVPGLDRSNKIILDLNPNLAEEIGSDVDQGSLVEGKS